MKVKYANRIYDVVDTKEMPGGLTMYGIEDEPGHIDYVSNVQVVGAENSHYGIKSEGSLYPTKTIKFE